MQPPNFGRRPSAACALASLLALPGLAAACDFGAAAPPTYTVVDLGTVDGATGYIGRAINRKGQVTGLIKWPNGRYGSFVEQSPAGAMVDLGSLGGQSTRSYHINRRGTIVGSATLPGEAGTHGFLWRKGRMVDLGTLGGTTSFALDIDDADRVVGGAQAADGVRHAFLYEDGVMQDLGTLGGGDTDAWAINGLGQVAGTAAPPGSDYRCFFYDQGHMVDIGTLGGAWCNTRGLNDAGQLAGYSTLPGNAVVHAFIYQNGATTDLGAMGGPWSSALGINRAGDVVGQVQQVDGGPLHAMLFHRGAMHDLNDWLDPVTGAGWVLSAALDISDKGQITGYGVINGEQHGFVLTPVKTNRANEEPAASPAAAHRAPSAHP